MLATLAQNWWVIVLRGACAFLFGLAAFIWPGMTLAALILVYGAYALVDGVLAVLWAVFARRSGPFPWAVLLAGLAAIAAGVIAFGWPAMTALALLYLIAGWALVRGVFEMIAAFHLRRQLEHEWLLGLSGLASAVLGVLLLIQPAVGVLAVLWWIATFAVVFGVLTIGLGFRLKAVRKRLEHRAATA